MVGFNLFESLVNTVSESALFDTLDSMFKVNPFEDIKNMNEELINDIVIF